jgi:DNA-binding NtrC family response regulator
VKDKQQVLIVDDDDMIGQLMAQIVQLHGHEARTVRRPEDALAALRETAPFALVVSDVRMPVMDGPTMIATAAALRAPLRVLFVSGHSLDALRRQHIDGVVHACLEKPFSLNGFGEQVDALLQHAPPASRGATA